jgi:hypothetical protein
MALASMFLAEHHALGQPSEPDVNRIAASRLCSTRALEPAGDPRSVGDPERGFDVLEIDDLADLGER